MRGFSSWHAYWFIRLNRFRKKKEIKKRLVAMSIDKTTAFYLLVVGGYLFASIFIFNDYLAMYQDEFLFIEQQAEMRFWLILMIVPIRYVFQAFRFPGLFISSSEYQLGMLPFSMRRITLYIALEKWVKQFIRYLMIGAIVVLLTPINPILIWLYFFIFWFIEVLMTIPQWKLFQMKWYVKLCVISALLLINIVGTLTGTTILFSVLILIVVLLSNFYWYGKIFTNINWGRVTEVNDYLIWSMPLVARATKTKFKRQRRYNIFLNSATRKKPFSYTESAIYKRLWLQYFRENIELVVKVIGGLLLAIIVLFFVHDLAALIGIAISIHVLTTFIASLYVDRFHTGIVQVLPWNVDSFKRTVNRWVLIGCIPLFIPIFIYSYARFSWHGSLFILLLISLFLFNYIVKMENAAKVLDKKLDSSLKGFLSFLLLGFILLCEINPYFSLVSIGIFSWIYFEKRYFVRKRYGV
ncbi:hypothetical protein [Ornithinibacillus bavariensis]|uniref:Uncharacterized protein n=1 Tax=Ornithinibacillus bavariensis TaxID=545502 RepID=A0A920C5V6_9BACI|nr:hypothetical protein [Ornithinibacillus bavariensis]GIO27130.1 hypothetical protein J43TS3_17410 [Ornithinibacillus bavariensis]